VSQADDNRWPPSIAEFGKGLRAGAFSVVETTQHALALAAASQEPINAFISITHDLALSQAAAVDAALADGRDLGPLMGVPVGIKDVFDLEGVATTAGSKLFADNVALSSAAAVSRLVEAGAVIVGKTNMDQFAFGPHQDDFGRTNCPADPTCYAGGSSGGSAAAVAVGCVLGALGSDAGGSTRFPAACCGVVGFKPTFGRVPTSGVFPTFWTLDHVGEIARSVSDLAEIFAAIADPAAQAHTALERPPRIAVLSDWQRECTPTVVASLMEAFARASAAGANVTEGVETVGMEDSLQILIATVGPEAWVALEPYLDGGRDAVPAALIEILSAAEQQRATDYVTAQSERRALRQAVDEALSDVDVIAMPTSLDVAWRWAEIDSSDMGVRDNSTFCLPLANLTGHPAISIPAPTNGLPVGLQLVGAVGCDERLLEVAAWLEKALH
jgi:aspartyl-tRNA(Asn)/glutamyl-tRNA(Gln) amidotransferase subunit A